MIKPNCKCDTTLLYNPDTKILICKECKAIVKENIEIVKPKSVYAKFENAPKKVRED